MAQSNVAYRRGEGERCLPIPPALAGFTVAMITVVGQSKWEPAPR